MRTLIVDLWKRATTWDKSVEVYSNDADNAYPERMDRLINNSVTAKSAANIMTQYLIGKGFGQADGVIVCREKNLSLIDFADDLANTLVKQRGAFIHVGWNMNYNHSEFSLIPFEWGRIGKKDSKNYNGKVAIFRDWAADKIKPEEVQRIDVYNPKKSVIDAQVENAKGFDKYKGQILFINMDSEYDYPLSRIDSVQMDCDTEAQISTYKNVIARKGFYGNTLIVTRPLIGDDTPEYIVNDEGNTVRNKDWDDANDERENFQKAIKQTLGAENAGGVLCLEMDFNGERLEDAILVKQIESKIDPDLFESIEQSLRDNILVAFNNLPVGLIKASEGVFGNSGESLKEMKRTYWENTTKERKLLESTINMLLKKFEGYTLGDVSVIELIESEEVEGTPIQEKLKAQSVLKGSVGGVQALLEIQRAVSAGTADYNAAVTIIEEIYGIDGDTARKMLGTPKIIEEPTPTPATP